MQLSWLLLVSVLVHAHAQCMYMYMYNRGLLLLPICTANVTLYTYLYSRGNIKDKVNFVLHHGKWLQYTEQPNHTCHSLPEYAGEVIFSLSGGTQMPWGFSSLVTVSLHNPGTWEYTHTLSAGEDSEWTAVEILSLIWNGLLASKSCMYTVCIHAHTHTQIQYIHSVGILSRQVHEWTICLSE